MKLSEPPVYSVFGDDPEMAEMVELFVHDMPIRIQCLGELLASADWEELGRFAHQLKGAAGGYGFDEITRLAARLEDAIRHVETEDEIRDATTALIDVCRRVRAGRPHEVLNS
jgi:HPt (histidine-containing phosphotransfer) domain-containing protein